MLATVLLALTVWQCLQAGLYSRHHEATSDTSELAQHGNTDCITTYYGDRVQGTVPNPQYPPLQ
jgi:hypothetical protein